MKILLPETLDEALEHLVGKPASCLMAGGTALRVEWEKGCKRPATLLSLSRLAGLDCVSISDEGIEIGALARLGDLLRRPQLRQKLPLLHAALNVTAGPAVRNLATIGGNVAGRTGCLLPALLALDAALRLETPDGPLSMPLADWLANPPASPAILTAIHLKPQPGNERWTFRKVGLRAAFTPSVINVAGRMMMDTGCISMARLAVGGGVVPPARLIGAEALITGRHAAIMDWSALHTRLFDTINAPDDDFRSSVYRRQVGACVISVSMPMLNVTVSAGRRSRSNARDDLLSLPWE